MASTSLTTFPSTAKTTLTPTAPATLSNTKTTTATTSAQSTTTSSYTILPTETTKEQINGTRLQMFRGLSEEACLDRFHNNDTQSFSRQPHKLYLELQEKKPQITRLKKQRVLQQDQYDLLIPPSGDTIESTKFDITLLMVLLTNFCGFKYPMKNWIPQSADIDIFANIVRVKQNRDKLQHKPFEVSDAEFKRIVPLFEQPLLALGVSQKKIDNVFKMRIIDEETKMTLQKYEQSQTSFNHNFIPPVTNFFSRDKELNELHEKLTNSFGSKLGTVLCGFPGLGKSETARQYWIKYGRSAYEDIIVWVSAENAATLESEFQDIGNECGIQKIKNPDGKYVEQKILVGLVYRHFASKITTSQRKVLFVFDGANDQNLLYQFLPKSIDYAPYILITSQCTSWDNNRFDQLELQVFSSKDALQFFIENTTRSQYENDKEIQVLLDEISCHPLALQQVVSYIQKNSITIGEYMSLLDQRKKEMLSEGTDQVGNLSVNNTMTISINRLKTINQDAVDLLDILAHLDGKEIKKGLLLMFFNEDMYILNKTLTLLRNFSIVNFDTNINNGVAFSNQVIQIHSLAQSFLESNQTKEYISKQLKKIADIFIQDIEACKDGVRPQDGRLWLNHFYKICENDFKKSKILKFFVDVLDLELLRDLFRSNENHDKLSEYSRYICEDQKQIHGEMHPVYLKTRYFLAWCLNRIGQREEATKIIEVTIKSQLAIVGPLDIDFLKSRTLLAIILMDKSKDDEIDRALQILEDIKKTLIESNPCCELYGETLQNIALCFKEKHEYETANKLYEEVLELQVKTLGPNHQSYLTTKHNLGSCYQDTGDYKTAIQLFEEIEEVELEILGPTNQSYLTTKHNLGSCYQDTGDYKTAIQLFEEIEEVKLQTLGPTNQSYLTTKHNLGLCYRDTGNYKTAIRLFEEIEEVELETLGPTNQSYLTTKHNLGSCYQDTGDYKTAIQLFEEIEEVKLQTLGPTNQSYLTTKHNLGLCYRDTGNYKTAIRLFEEIEEVELETLGPTNQTYLTVKHYLAMCYRDTGDYKTAIQLLEEIEEMQLKTLGSTNLTYLTAKHNLAMCYRDTGDYKTATKLFEEIEEVKLKTLGPTNENYLKTKHYLGLCYQDMYECEIISESEVEGIPSEEE